MGRAANRANYAERLDALNAAVRLRSGVDPNKVTGGNVVVTAKIFENYLLGREDD